MLRVQCVLFLPEAALQFVNLRQPRTDDASSAFAGFPRWCNPLDRAKNDTRTRSTDGEMLVQLGVITIMEEPFQ